MGTEGKRLLIINKLKSTFKATEGIQQLSRDRLVGELCMTHGVTMKKANEYIDVLINGGYIYQDLHGLWLAKAYRT